MTIDEKQNEIIAEFSGVRDWLEKYEALIHLGKELEPLDVRYRTEENAVKGCQSEVWIYTKLEEGKVHFLADSDAMITKGLIALVLRVLNHQPPEDIVDADLYFIDRIGLSSHLSPSRAAGLASIVKHMEWHALGYLRKEGKALP